MKESPTGPPEPDPLEKRIRFGCGFVFGALLAFSFAVKTFAAFSGFCWVLVAAVAIMFGVLAVRGGDEFWTELFQDWFRWW